MIEELSNNVFLAPMAGVTDRATREIADKFGAALTFTEMVSSKGLYYKDKKTKTLLEQGEGTEKTSIQLFGHESEIMEYAAGCAVSLGASLIDINSGCPTPKIAGNGDGAGLMKNPDLFGEVVKATVRGSGVPVSVKIRKGWNDESVNAVEIAKIAEKNGASMITVHGRTAQQQYSGRADWDIIKEVTQSVGIPVVGNGDIFSPLDAKKMLDKTGCAAVMLGRGTLGNPWLISDTVSFLRSGEIPPSPTLDEKIKLAIHHIGLIVKYKGEYIGIREARKHALWYIKGIRGSASIKNRITKAQSLEEMKNILILLLTI